MEIMKKRGARRPRPKKAAKRGGDEEEAPEGESFVPLQIFAEGDSWFEYPAPFFLAVALFRASNTGDDGTPGIMMCQAYFVTA